MTQIERNNAIFDANVEDVLKLRTTLEKEMSRLWQTADILLSGDGYSGKYSDLFCCMAGMDDAEGELEALERAMK